jgi:hypothetical protein
MRAGFSSAIDFFYGDLLNLQCLYSKRSKGKGSNLFFRYFVYEVDSDPDSKGYSSSRFSDLKAGTRTAERVTIQSKVEK